MSRIRALPVEIQKVAEKELNEVTARVPKDLQALRLWIEQQPHLNARLDEQFLIQYLRGCKYDLAKAKEKIDLFFTLKTKFPEFINVTDVNEENFRKIHNYGLGIPLPRPLNDNGARIYFMKFEGDVAKGLVNIEELYRITNAMHEIIMMDDSYACINGIIYLMDMKDITMNMASKFTPTFIYKLLQFYEKSLPLRIKAIYMINTPAVFYSVLNIMLPLFTEKLRQRIKVYDDNYNELLEILPNEYLPQDLGGENGCRQQLIKDFEKKWSEYANYFKENINYGTDELLRPGNPIDFDSLYGLGGSFRKLEVD